MPRRRHHVISSGYQRFFADREQIILVNKLTRIGVPVGTRDAFVEKHFNSWRDSEGRANDELEDSWMKQEAICLPDVRRLVSGEDSPRARDATKVLAALHFGRSYAFEEMQSHIVEQVTAEYAHGAESKEHLRRAFFEEMGRQPQAGEIADQVRAGAELRFGGRRQLVMDMARAFNVAIEKLIPLHVQVVRRGSRRVAFMFGDQPLVHSAGLRVGVRRLPLGEADQIFMPISPDLAVAFTTQPEPDVVLTAVDVQQVNMRTWQAAGRYLAAHPATDISMSLGYAITDKDGQRI